jgi:Fe-S oxidoreductase
MSLIKERLPQVIQNIAHNLQKNNLQELICYHDECHAGFTYWAEAYGVNVPFRSIHQYDYLVKQLKARKERIRPLGVKVAYQRPCSNRLIPETQGFVDQIFELIEAEKVPRKHEGQNALCCGSVLILQGRDDLADDVQQRNIDDMLEAGAEYCVFNCPMCFYTLGESISKKGMQPVMMSELCQYTLGEREQESQGSTRE